MANRYLRPADAIIARWAATPKPFAFAGTTPADWAAWRRRFLPALLAELGPTPEPVPLAAEITATVDCGSYLRHHVLYDTEAYATVPAWLLVPKAATAENPVPGILCAHGHGPGKDALVGLNVEGLPVEDARYCLLANQLAEAGYVVISPDWRGFGERKDTDPWVRRPGRDGCNVYYLAAGYLGYHSLALQIHDGRRTIDYLQSLPEVRPDKIGCCGLSFGGTMTTYLSALDDRIGCAVICCYLSTLGNALKRANFCGAQYMPGLGKLADIPDVAGLIAPRPMMAEMGEQDACFTIDDAFQAYQHVERIYTAAGVPERCAVDRFEGEHEVHGTMMFDWMAQWLGPGATG